MKNWQQSEEGKMIIARIGKKYRQSDKAKEEIKIKNKILV